MSVGRIATAALALAAVAALGLFAARRLWTRPAAPLSDAGPPLAPLCEKAAGLFCQKLEACGGMAHLERPACVARHAADCDADLGWRLRRGILAQDGEAEEECIEGLQSAQCGAVLAVLGDDDQDVLELTDRCEEQELKPRSGLGAPCALPGDCTAGSCPYAEPGCHSCRPFAPTGGACALGVEACDPARDYCAREWSGGRCAALKQAGASCAQAEECKEAICRLGADGTRRCASPPEARDCHDSRDCAKESFCRAGAGGGRCEPRAKTGEACTADARESVCLDAEARCVHGRCRVRPFSEAEGAPCRDLGDCESGLYCRWRETPGGEGLCTRYAAAGAACRALDYGACGLGARCIEGSCRTLAARGQPCAGPYQCLAELECVPRAADAGFAGGATCLPQVELGGACGPYRSCREGFCRESGGGGSCVAKAGAGAPCRTREECLSGRCQSVGAGPATCQGPCG